jgi:serine/threonine protein kinase/Tol biopolymer transport system component
MGEVYRARDSRLGRVVAVKVLPEPFAAQPELRQRFEREARAVSSLNHPHICALYDVGRQDGIDYLVMEYLEGETLADRLSKGALPTDQVVLYGIQIAEALDKAHRHGIVHRDLKPGNVMLTKSGAKLLDFGLVKRHASGAPAASALSALVTEERPLTAHGVVLGTFQYMAPEQLEGKEADPRADIFALGTILYEMATGRKAFVGKTQTSLIAAILSSDPPPLTSVQPLTPAALERLVKVCLAKDPDDRLQTAHDVMQELKWIAESPSGSAPSSSLPSRFASRERLAWILAALLPLLTWALTLHSTSRPAPPVSPTRFEVGGPKGAVWVSYPLLSPDGRHIAYIATVDEVTSVWVRPLDSLDERRVPGTEGVASEIMWSGDSRSVGFVVGDALQRVALDGGPAFTICRMKRIALGEWSTQGTVLFSSLEDRRIYKVAASGGTPTAVTDAREGVEQMHPSFLPDERHFLFSARQNQPESAIFVASLDSPEVRELLPADSQALYAPPGQILFVRGRTLLAQPFDPRSRRLHGEPIPVADELARERTWFYFSVSTTGTLAYKRQPRAPVRLTWFDRGGRVLGTVGGPGDFVSPEIAPDGRRVVVVSRDAAFLSNEILVLDLERGGSQRVTPEPGPYFAPVWSSDGRSVFFGRGPFLQPGALLRRASDGAGSEEVVFDDAGMVRPTDVSPDGRLLAYWSGRLDAGSQLIRALRPNGGPPPFELPVSSAARFSPDGRWLAYWVGTADREEIRVEPHPPTGARWLVAPNAYQPRWRRDGKELFYLAMNGTLMAVDTTLGPTQFRASTPRALFKTTLESPWMWGPHARNLYDVAPDGKRFLVAVPVGASGPTPTTVILNWAVP